MSAPSFSFQNFITESKSKPLISERALPISGSVNGHLKKERELIKLQESSRSSNNGDDEIKSWKNKVPAFVPILSWIFFSSSVILQNKYILSDLKFSHPIALTSIHLLFQTLATRGLRSYSNLIDGAKELESTGKMNRKVFLHKILPVGILFSLSLILSNWVYLRLTVSFIQMIKAFTPVSVLLISFAVKLKEPSQKLFGIVVAISLGVAIASYGEVEFDLLGFSVQALAIAIESCRLILIQILLSGMNMNPLVALYYFAPVCLVFNSLILLPIEGLQPFSDAVNLVGIPTLVLNCLFTFALNLSSVAVIGSCSGLVLTLAGVIKDILLIAGSWIVLGSTITLIQVFGYSIALGGLIMFKLS